MPSKPLFIKLDQTSVSTSVFLMLSTLIWVPWDWEDGYEFDQCPLSSPIPDLGENHVRAEEKAFSAEGTWLGNNLPEEIRQIQSLIIFLKEFLYHKSCSHEHLLLVPAPNTVPSNNQTNKKRPASPGFWPLKRTNVRNRLKSTRNFSIAIDFYVKAIGYCSDGWQQETLRLCLHWSWRCTRDSFNLASLLKIAMRMW